MDDTWSGANGEFYATAPVPPPPGPVAGETRTGVGDVVPVGRRLKFGEALEVGLNLARSSWNVVSRAPSLLAVTAISLAASVMFILVYAKLAGGFAALESGGGYVAAVKDFPLLAILGVTSTLAQAVIVAVVRDMFDGRRTSLTNAWGATVARAPQLVGFGLIYAGERTLTNMLRNTRGGKSAARALDYGWDFATYLAIPAIMFEPGVGSFRAVKRSAQLVRTRFGVQLAATGAISLAVLVCALPLFLVALFVGVAVSAPAGIGLGVTVLAAEIVVAGTLQGVCSAVMYRFITTGVVGGQFSATQLMRVFGVRPALA